jgi:hypothetical protein
VLSLSEKHQGRRASRQFGLRWGVAFKDLKVCFRLVSRGLLSAANFAAVISSESLDLSASSECLPKTKSQVACLLNH